MNDSDFTVEERAIIERVTPYTMTSAERIVAQCRAIDYLVRVGVPGDLVECGVWRGGSMMAAALRLQQLGVNDRTLWLYDTFHGMPPPQAIDVDYLGRSAKDLLAAYDNAHYLARAGLPEVQALMRSTGYSLVRYVSGDVKDTLPATAPAVIAMLRLDTDWYSSTYHELTHLYPLVSEGGVVIIDDYGHWEGARHAVDQYIEQHRLPLLLHRIDYTGRLAVKLPGGWLAGGCKP